MNLKGDFDGKVKKRLLQTLKPYGQKITMTLVNSVCHYIL